MVSNRKTKEHGQVMVYGSAWCEQTTHVRRLLADWGVPHHYIDVDKDEYAFGKVARWNLGEPVIPVVSCGVLETPRLIAPSDAELHELLYVCSGARVGPLLL
jgi:glutaredoxin